MSNVNSMFADDVAILVTKSTLEEAQEAAQEAVDIVTEWAKRWKLRLNAGKSESSFFTTATNEAKWTPKIIIEEETIKHEPTPRLLGVILDRTLQFGPHVDKVVEKIESRQKLLRAVANTSWGWRKENLVQIYSAYINSAIEYSGFAWLSSVAKTHRERLEVAANKAIRLVTGQYLATPVEALRLECGLPSFGTQVTRMIAKAAEKAHRLPADHPRRLAFENDQAPRIKKSTWRSKAKELNFQLTNMENRAPIEHYKFHPWTDAPCLEVYASLEGVKSRLDDIQVRRASSIRRIQEVNADLTIYTDGSATGGTRMGGAGVVITDGNAESPHIIDTIQKKGALFTCSYEEEVQAMLEAAAWIEQNCVGQEDILICTDSLSLCMALDNYNPETDGIRDHLKDHRGKITIQWIPGHADVPGNDLADQAAKDAAMALEETRDISYRSACMMINQTFKDTTTHQNIKSTYSKYNKEREKQISSREDQVLLARVRSGKHLAFRSYQHTLDENVSPDCPRCGEEEHTDEHWMCRCPATLGARRDMFGEEMNCGLSLLTKYPKEAVSLSRRLLLGEGRQ